MHSGAAPRWVDVLCVAQLIYVTVVAAWMLLGFGGPTITHYVALLDLAPWQHLADQYYQGDIERLIRYHLASSDPKFQAEGAVIRALVTNVQQLQSAVDALHGSVFHQAAYLALHADPGLVRATLHDWVPTFALSSEGIVFALAFAVVVWLLFQVLWGLIALLVPQGRAPRARARI